MQGFSELKGSPPFGISINIFFFGRGHSCPILNETGDKLLDLLFISSLSSKWNTSSSDFFLSIDEYK